GLQLGENSSGKTKTAIFNSEGGSEIGLTIQSRTNRAKLKVADNDSAAYVVAEAGKAFFGVSPNGDSNNITVLSSGNVGIGTDSPSEKLTIDSEDDTTALGINFPSAKFDFAANSTSGYNTLFKMDDTGLDIGHDSNSRAINLKTGDLDRVTISGNGNVGIGTNSPDSLLHIAGPFPRITLNDTDASNSNDYSLIEVSDGVLQ
ncbi:MAG: hypothetical protein GY823_00795, partial [Flavobacteriaceae bacterium]|nr:hypothetical protein [Flavobacteriaceae bacterium]